MKKEDIVNVPLDPKVKKDLERQAEANGRATNREAAQLIKDGLRKGSGK